MKKLSLVLVGMLAFALAFTSCQQPGGDPDMKLDDLKDTEWMMGTWKADPNVYKYDVDITGENVPEETKAIIKALYSKDVMQASLKKEYPDITVTEKNVNEFKALLENEIKNAGKQSSEKNGQKQEYEKSIKLSKDKTKITMYERINGTGEQEGMKISIDSEAEIFYTKQK